jgi:hypothetical protein
MSFTITGSDDAVKSALNVISEINLMTQVPYQIRVKIELANEHKEFVSGKKNGKINKIMGQSKSTSIIGRLSRSLTKNLRQCSDHFRWLQRVQLQHRRHGRKLRIHEAGFDAG